MCEGLSVTSHVELTIIKVLAVEPQFFNTSKGHVSRICNDRETFTERSGDGVARLFGLGVHPQQTIMVDSYQHRVHLGVGQKLPTRLL